MLLLQQEELLDATVDIVASVIPGVTRVVFLNVRPAVSQITADTSSILCFNAQFVQESTYTSPVSG